MAAAPAPAPRDHQSFLGMFINTFAAAADAPPPAPDPLAGDTPPETPRVAPPSAERRAALADPLLQSSKRQPSPEETAASTQETLHELACHSQLPAVRDLDAYLRDLEEACRPPRDPATNIIDIGPGRCYALPMAERRELFRHLDACRDAGATMHFMERQWYEGVDRTGIMVDFDMPLRRMADQPAPEPLEERHVMRLTSQFVARLLEDLEGGLSPTGKPVPRTERLGEGAEQTMGLFYVTKPDRIKNGRWHRSFHLLMPGARVGREFKRYFVGTLREDEIFLSVFERMGALDPADVVDPNSGSVPVHLLGSCKRGGAPHELTIAYDVAMSYDEPVYSCISPEQFLRRCARHGLSVAEALSLGPSDAQPPGFTRREYSPSARALARMPPPPPPPGAAEEPEDVAMLLADNSLSMLAVTDPEAAYLHQVLDILAPPYYEERNKWRDVVYALGNTSPRYRPLAEWFSQKYHRWRDGTSKRLAAFDALWRRAVEGRPAAGQAAGLTKRSIFWWAKACDPVRFRRVQRDGHFGVLARHAWAGRGNIEHFDVAEVLYTIMSQSFVTDTPPGEDGDYRWYEFVAEGTPHRPGEVWKWRRESARPDTLTLYLSKQLQRVYDEVRQHILDTMRAETAADKQKFYKQVLKAFEASARKLGNNGYKNAVVAEARTVFRQRGFVESLDADGTVIGVGNGVLELPTAARPRARLVTGYHEHRVMRHTPAPFSPFDPRAPTATQARVLQMFADTIPELDARRLLLYFMATGLLGEFKDPKMLQIVGGGSNGKTALLNLWVNTLGEDYGTKLPIQLLTTEREKANETNTAVMQFKHRRAIMFEESKKGERVNDARVKEIVNPGVMSANDKYKAQETFRMIATIISATNHEMLTNASDHGFWRRIWLYVAKVRFCATPDPNNPFEKKDDPSVVKNVPLDPAYQEAMLGILTWFLEDLVERFDGSVDNLPRPTIERETQIYRNSQDRLNRFISHTVVLTDGAEESAEAAAAPAGRKNPNELSQIAAAYRKWHADHIGRGEAESLDDIMRDLQSSAIQKYLRLQPDRSYLLEGCRVLSDEEPMRPGERFLLAAAHERTLNYAEIQRVNEAAGQFWWIM